MAPVQFVSLDDFRARKLQPNKAMSVFLHKLRQMLKQAMPEAGEGTRKQLLLHQFVNGLPVNISKQLLLHQFVNGLPVNISKQLRATGALDNLDVVLERAKLPMTIEEPQNTAAVQTNKIRDLKEQISLLTEEVAALSSKPTRRSAAVICYRYKRPGHLQRNCPLIRKCYLCGQAGHVV